MDQSRLLFFILNFSYSEPDQLMLQKIDDEWIQTTGFWRQNEP